MCDDWNATDCIPVASLCLCVCVCVLYVIGEQQNIYLDNFTYNFIERLNHNWHTFHAIGIEKNC